MYKMYLGINNGEEGFTLPVLPEKIEINENGDNKTFDVINLGEINTINLPKLTEISFESFLPRHRGPYVSSEQLFSPDFYISKIREWREKKQKIRFIFVGSPLEINDLFTVENLKLVENGGEVGDIYYSIELKRYKPYAAKKVVIVNNSSKAIIQSSPPPRPTEDTTAENTYTVVSGDTLWYIAKKCLGDGSRWREIYNLNSDVIESSDMIYPGQVFRLP
ncbi:LysM peptidoglycan-binding domain-containing protein [Clostridium algidicarnis]|uniref:LysM peptidoglycan-binding domain-containing protein n=1 Tax=Clostridium algidicarnis TaxID=37659 RepID=UPI001C0BFF9E|nr:LysM peptidoglycan-binding domain-containing protein [Clostridium algidicarnis]MBU3193461.1 LysM peptidoglycan-binding domain-containing protein [Clostridium algidicarnis]MBU3203134.1 LysM peptidoglycan-binding domain-containing protein [Clostridium algidicarnis]MBU3211288.1 LysM peptidoglycan-binding domain-containing protein [Clostridium algidicarnis]MBU3222204.1 LysM peptidoglycan-binding domain-containing protein [Clostridium algidicarnis]